MQLIADLHTHTLASGHAYATYTEMAQGAAEKGLKVLGITDHGPDMPGGPQPIYFYNLREMPPYCRGVRLIHGIEANIMDNKGNWDVEERMLPNLELIIASLHNVPFPIRTQEYCTAAIIGAMEHKEANIVGHPDTGRMPVDPIAIVRAARRHHKIIEINNHSMDSQMEKAAASYRVILAECKKLDIPVIISSDAHVPDNISSFGHALPLLAEADFPQELVVNASIENLDTYLGIKM